MAAPTVLLSLLTTFYNQAAPAWDVRLSSGASAVEHFAATELQSLLAAMCPPPPLRRHTPRHHHQPHIVRTASPRPEVELYVGYESALRALGGPTPDSAKLLGGLGDEGFVLASVRHSSAPPSPPAYVLAGGNSSARGTLYAVYEWLHQLGVRFFAHDEAFFPACPASLGGGGAPLPSLAPKQWRPSLDYRFLTTAPDSPTMDQHYLWLLRNRFNVVLGEDWKAPPNG
jgi:hypothetical protein